MKILFVSRLYSGLVDTINSENWHPKGIPTVYKLIEQLNEHKDIDLHVIFTCERENDITISKPTSLNFKELRNTKFTGLPYYSKTKKMVFLFCNLFVYFCNPNKLYHLIYVVKKILLNKYDLIYCDRTNIDIAAFSAWFLRKKVFFRVLGAYQDMLELADNSLFQKRIQNMKKKPWGFSRWLEKKKYRAPFTFVLNTEDGSGGDYFVSKMIRKDIPRKTLLNGVNFPIENDKDTSIIFLRQKYNLPADHLIILFVGKLETHKGCREFIESTIRLYKVNRKFTAFVIGNGSLFKNLQDTVKESNLLDRIIFTGLIDHREVYVFFQAADIYVSLNVEGNLSNTVLEAIAYGKCIVRLASDNNRHKDIYTDKILTEDHASTVHHDKILEELPDLLNHLLNHQEKIDKYSQIISVLAKKRLWSWEERIKSEINLIREI